MAPLARLSPAAPRARIAERPPLRQLPARAPSPPISDAPSQPPGPMRPAPPRARPAPREKFPRVALPRASRRPPANHTRLHINVGVAMGVTHGDVVGAILGETGLPASVVGAVDIRDRHLFVEVDSEHTNSIISKLNRTTLKGRGIKAKRVSLNPPPGTEPPPDSAPSAP